MRLRVRMSVAKDKENGPTAKGVAVRSATGWGESPVAKAASDYFNSLPIEQRRALGPLLEEYRRIGMVEYAEAMRSAARKMEDRMRGIARRQEEAAA
jgi:hypothetical protein